jgi:hypothetical protein
MQEFYIRQYSVNPILEMELIADGRYDFQKSLIQNALQDSRVTFSMKDEETGLLKVAKAEANIVLASDGGCDEKYILQYKWKDKDVAKKGVFNGWFEITFNGDICDGDGTEYPEGNLIVPVEEELRIFVK